ncbi:MAG: hypothetical protein JSV09_09720, partial [Thermoplasmata archaeon]
MKSKGENDYDALKLDLVIELLKQIEKEMPKTMKQRPKYWVDPEYLYFCNRRLEEEPTWNVMLYIKSVFIWSADQIFTAIGQIFPQEEFPIDPTYLVGVKDPEN